jgi:hypothetical protein
VGDMAAVAAVGDVGDVGVAIAVFTLIAAHVPAFATSGASARTRWRL